MRGCTPIQGSPERRLASSRPSMTRLILSFLFVCLFLSSSKDIFFSLLLERERETSVGCLLVQVPTRDRTCSLGMCPDGESKLQPFDLWDHAPTNRARRPGLHLHANQNDDAPEGGCLWHLSSPSGISSCSFFHRRSFICSSLFTSDYTAPSDDIF